ncbi:MAG: polysaccharide deacetylase family protein [Candidatus Limnocylindrales bacterium]
MLLLAYLIVSPTMATAGGVTVVSHGSRTAPVVALTFDDGTNPANCRRLFATLLADRVPATFFPKAQAMRLDPAFWRIVADAGYPIGDHTLTHPELPTLSYKAQEAEITGARRLAESITGRPMLRAFRPPYGAYDATTLAAAGAAGFPTVLLWDTSDRDTSPSGTLPEMLAAGEAGRNGSIVLLHCWPDATPWLLPSLIASYQARGFRFVTIPQLLHVPWSPGGSITVPTPASVLGGLPLLPPLSARQQAGFSPSPGVGGSPAASGLPSPSGSSAPSVSVTPSLTATEPANSPSPTMGGTGPASPSAALPAPSGSVEAPPSAAVWLLVGLIGAALIGLVAIAAWRRHRRPAR